MLRGTRLHLLMEHLPAHPASDWPRIARAILSGAEGGLPDDPTLAALIDEAAAVIGAEALAPAFTPAGATVLREVPLAVDLPGIGPLSGTIDRLIVEPDRVLVIDYKSNAAVPADAAATPEGYLRQMAAYRHALRAIWPGHRIDTALLWTRARALMELPDPLLDAAWDAALRGLDQGPAAS